jgi:glycosyltransferase involved in cell wall biosynthesis
MKRRKVALNGRFSGTLQPTGTQTVAFRLFDAIVRSPRDFSLEIFADPAFKGVGDWADVPHTHVERVPFSRWSRAKAQLWEQTLLPWELKRRECDLVHHPIVTCPRWNFGTTTVVTLHDLNFYHHPEWMDPKFRWWVMTTAIPGIKKAAHVVAISDFVLEDMRRTLGLAEDKTSRIYNGTEWMGDSAIPEARPKRATILGVNLWQPHKNLPRLLEALAILRQDMPEVGLHLVGRPQANFKNSPDAARCLEQPGVKTLGYLSQEELARAYAQATVFCYPSLYEGFGLPVLEAMSAGTPVVTSDAASLPEIAGGAAILVDPLSPQDLARGLKQALLENESQRASRIAAGRKVAARFTWEEAARQYISLYDRLAPRGERP